MTSIALYQALIQAKVPEDLAVKAADYGRDHDRDTATEIASAKTEIASIRTELRMHRWVLGIVIAIQLATMAVAVSILLTILNS